MLHSGHRTIREQSTERQEVEEYLVEITESDLKDFQDYKGCRFIFPLNPDVKPNDVLKCESDNPTKANEIYASLKRVERDDYKVLREIGAEALIKYDKSHTVGIPVKKLNP